MHIFFVVSTLREVIHSLFAGRFLSQLLDVLESYCMAEGLDYSRLDGGTKAKERIKIVKEFNSSAHTNLCLVSTMWVQQSHSERFCHFRDPAKKRPQNCCCSSCIATPFFLPPFSSPTYIILPLFLGHLCLFLFSQAIFKYSKYWIDWYPPLIVLYQGRWPWPELCRS